MTRLQTEGSGDWARGICPIAQDQIVLGVGAFGGGGVDGMATRLPKEAGLEDVVKERLDSFRVAKEDLAEIGASARSDVAKVKAITAPMNVLKQETDFMMEVGLIPSKGQPL